MAQETHVLFGGKLPGRAALNLAMKQSDFRLRSRLASHRSKDTAATCR